MSEAVASDEETASYVEELERRVDSLEEEEEGELPTGDSIHKPYDRGSVHGNNCWYRLTIPAASIA